MAKDGRGIIIVIIGAAVVAAALALVYLVVLAPRAQKSKMQDEVAAFAGRWDKLRACFYGGTARSSSPADAVILRELTDPELSTEIAVCEESLREARREEGPTTGIAEVESRWTEMTEARRDLAKALAIRLQVPPPRPVPQLRAAVGEAAARAEAAYAALREAAGLDPDPLEGSPVSDATLEPIAVGGAPAEQVWVAGNRILAARRDGDKRLFAILDGSGEPAVETVAAGDTPAFGARWVARIRDGALLAVELDAPAEGGAAREVEVARTGSEPMGVVAALDNGKSGRLIAARKGPALALFRSTDGGLSWKSEALHGDGIPMIESDPLNGRVVVAWDASRFEIGGPDLASARRPRFATPCFADAHSWWLTSSGLIVGGFDEPLAPVTGSEEMPWLANACTDTQALGVGPFDSEIELPATRLRLCERKGCRVSASLPRAHGADLAATIGPLVGPIVAFAADRIALVWAGAKKGAGLKPRSWVRLPEGARLAALVEWKGQIRGVVETGAKDKRGFALVPFK